MKKILLYSLTLLLSLSVVTSSIAQQRINIKTKGVISSNAENEDNEADPTYNRVPIKNSLPKKVGSGNSNQQQVSDLENGLQIVKDVVDRMLNNEFSFALMSSHKYMVNSCLGIKASAGTFKLRFEKPTVTLSNSGTFTIKLEVNRIDFNALKIRMKPCGKVTHLGSPCHFGTRFEIGGEATNVKLTVSFNLIANGIIGNQGFCFLAFQGNFDAKWSIGGLNLKPLQNNLDGYAKDMIEDALNGGLDDLFLNKFIDFTREIMPNYYSHCENAYDLSQQVQNMGDEVANVANNNNNDDDSKKWVVSSVKDMKGVLGRLNLEYPQGVDWSMEIRKGADNGFITSRSGYSRHGSSYDMAPGTYNFELNSILVEGVPIEKGKQTRLKSGVLNIVSAGHWELYDDSKEKLETTGNKQKKFALPIGKYQLKLGKEYFPVEIKDGKEVEL